MEFGTGALRGDLPDDHSGKAAQGARQEIPLVSPMRGLGEGACGVAKFDMAVRVSEGHPSRDTVPRRDVEN